MAQPPQNRQQQDQPAQQTQPRQRYSRDEQPQPTHLIARARGARPFRRAGLRFEAAFQATALTDLSPEQVKRILAEPAIEARLADEDEARRFMKVQDVEIDESVSRAELVQYIHRQHVQLEEMSKRISQLEASRGDMPPKQGEQPPGIPSGQ